MNVFVLFMQKKSHVEINLNYDLPICLVRITQSCYISGQLVVPNFRLSQQYS